MANKKLDTTGLSLLWNRVFTLIKVLTGDVDVTGKGTLQEQINNMSSKISSGDTASNTVKFTSADSATAESWTDVAVLTSGEKHSSIFNKISVMFKNIRYLYAMQDGLTPVDPRLATEEGFPADAKLTGDALSELNSKLNSNNNSMEWEKIDINVSASDSTSWNTVGTYPQLIGKSEAVFSTSTGLQQIRVINMGTGTECHGSYALAIGNNTNDATSEFKVDFTNGTVYARQMLGDSAKGAAYSCLYYR